VTTKLLLVIKNPNEDLELAKNYIEGKKHDDFFIKNLKQIKKHLQSYTIVNDELYNNNNKVNYPIKLYLKDQFGMIKESKIVKMLEKHQHAYEIRIEREIGRVSSYTHRITYCLDSELNLYILTFGFTKSYQDTSNKFKDVTDLCGEETDKIKIQLLNKEYSKWLGEEDYYEL